MSEGSYITDVIEKTRQEILFAIKERISEITSGNDAPLQLKDVVIGDVIRAGRVSLNYYEVNNVFVNENGILCGDLVCRHGKFFGDVFFGKSIEDLAIENLKLILDALYRGTWHSGQKYIDVDIPDRKTGFSGFFLGTYESISRILRKDA
jgi:hypothetical protein